MAPGSYNLILDVYDPVSARSYQDTKALVYRSKKFDAHIFSDKAMYKPGDTIYFSIFCINSETQPYNPQGSSVSIYDADEVKIKTFTNISFVKGKYKNSLDLTDLAAEGIWKIKFDGESEVVK